MSARFGLASATLLPGEQNHMIEDTRPWKTQWRHERSCQGPAARLLRDQPEANKA